MPRPNGKKGAGRDGRPRTSTSSITKKNRNSGVLSSAMGAYDELTPEQLMRIRRFVERGDVDTELVSEELRNLVDEHWPWLLPKLEPQTLH
jgi:hypothetical protein